MITKKLTQASRIAEKLVNFLEQREWEKTDEITNILARADRDIERIQEKAICDVLAKLQGTYSREASQWANNDGHIKLNKAELNKAQTEYARIQKAVSALYEVIYNE